MALITVKQYMGPQGGSRDVLISTEHVVSVVPSDSQPGYHQINLVHTPAGLGFVIVENTDAQKLIAAINNSKN